MACDDSVVVVLACVVAFVLFVFPVVIVVLIITLILTENTHPHYNQEKVVGVRRQPFELEHQLLVCR